MFTKKSWEEEVKVKKKSKGKGKAREWEVRWFLCFVFQRGLDLRL